MVEAAGLDHFARVRIGEARLAGLEEHGRVHGRDDRPPVAHDDAPDLGEEGLEVREVLEHEARDR